MNIRETEIVKIWQRQLIRKDLVDSEGMPVKIIYPGRPNDGRGADFRDAVVSSGGEIRQGCIEVHAKVSGWKSHGHHEDPVYNNVVLHVALEEDRRGRIILQNGQSIPTVILDKTPDIINNPGQNSLSETVTNKSHTTNPKAPGLSLKRCVFQDHKLQNSHKSPFQNRDYQNEHTKVLQCQKDALKRDLVTTLKIIERRGNLRFAGKAARYMEEISRMEAAQSLYQGICEALGYTKNKIPFIELAAHAPLSVLEGIAASTSRQNALPLDGMQALLLEQAGFLSSRHVERYLDKDYLENLRNQMADSKKTENQNRRTNSQEHGEDEKYWGNEDNNASHDEISADPAWELFKVRPGNHPIIRILALSHLVYRFRQKGLLPGFLEIIVRTGIEKCRSVLEAALIVEARKTRGEFFRGMRSPNSCGVLLGRERAAEIIINVILPFTVAWSRMNKDLKLVTKAREIYRRYPALETNSIERHMLAQLGLSRQEVNSALRQQGLVQVYKSLCTQGRCGECELGKIKTSNDL